MLELELVLPELVFELELFGVSVSGLWGVTLEAFDEDFFEEVLEDELELEVVVFEEFDFDDDETDDEPLSESAEEPEPDFDSIEEPEDVLLSVSAFEPVSDLLCEEACELAEADEEAAPFEDEAPDAPFESSPQEAIPAVKTRQAVEIAISFLIVSKFI